ncbi:Spermidine/putrescine ABC transporter, ATP-binding protein [Haemophilus influenzae]|uniref:Spermidine/putrescine ABC transporter, ATP-binding protein n=1 Tax=Haemophilus influenzae TaxID=727 RepID=A0A2X1PU58_HAEIF|nr:Spermidine/putrescine ABC transporter, ATP-binding protein [Haemophilus influenzae]
MVLTPLLTISILQLITVSLSLFLALQAVVRPTVLRLLAGLEELDSGSIILDGEDITNVPAENVILIRYSKAMRYFHI